jgi:hypothetical protein
VSDNALAVAVSDGYRDSRSRRPLAVNAVSSAYSKCAYERALKDFLAWSSVEAEPRLAERSFSNTGAFRNRPAWRRPHQPPPKSVKHPAPIPFTHVSDRMPTFSYLIKETSANALPGVQADGRAMWRCRQRTDRCRNNSSLFARSGAGRKRCSIRLLIGFPPPPPVDIALDLCQRVRNSGG